MWTAEDCERYKDDGRRYPSDLTEAEWALDAAENVVQIANLRRALQVITQPAY